MTLDNGKFSRRRVLAGIGAIGAATAVGGAGTWALMSDEASSNNNTINSGEMELTLGSNVSKTVDVTDLMPGEGAKETFTVSNTGDADGSLEVVLNDVRNSLSSPGAPSPNVRRFESQMTGYFDYGTHDNEVLLSEFGVDDAVTEIDLSGSNIQITVDLPAPLGAASSGDNLALAFDADNDGSLDFQVLANASGSTGVQGPATDVAVSLTNGQQTLNVTIGSGVISPSSTFGFGGQVIYNGLHNVNGMGPSDGINDRVLLTPGFSFGPGFNGSANRYTTIDPNNVRTLDDVVDVELRVDTDLDSPELDEDDDGDLMVQGKPNRIEGQRGGSSDLDEGQIKRVEVIYRLPKNAGNTVANQTTVFDLDMTLTQRPGAPE